MSKALISVSNKDNLEFLAKGLAEVGYEIIATGTTAETIKSYGVDCRTVEDITGFPEILGGRVKTLNPFVHGGILANLSLESHREELKKMGIPEISLVVCNLYPFEEVLKKEGAEHSELIENIDIGGVTLIRASSKNHNHVTTLCDPTDYERVVNEIKEFGKVTEVTRLDLAMKGFIQTAQYDIMIANYFQKKNNSENHLLVAAEKKGELRYGENPHQNAAYFGTKNKTCFSLETSEVLWGKPLSYNNMLDIDANLMILKEFSEPASVAMKHNTPCGVGVGANVFEAYVKAHAVDPVSIFGGIVSVNSEVDKALAEKMIETFLEIVMAPSFTDEALEVLKTKKNLRILKITLGEIKDRKEIKSVQDGFLVQDTDLLRVENESFEVVTKGDKKINLKTLTFLQTVCKFAKSNAIVVGQEGVVLGIGSGEVNRIDACKMAVERATKNSFFKKENPLFLASDAFFPFEDIIDYVKDYNIKFIIQPGGSVRDNFVIEAANQEGIEIVFTGVRHFKH